MKTEIWGVVIDKTWMMSSNGGYIVGKKEWAEEEAKDVKVAYAAPFDLNVIPERPKPELKECPFCGNGAHITFGIDGFRVWCNGCGCNVWQYKAEEDAVKAWNMRSNDT